MVVTPVQTARLNAVALFLAASSALAAPAEIVVNVAGPGHAVPKSLYGIFFEEINRAGDGGIYAEMIQNRSFEDDADKLAGWTVIPSAATGAITLDASAPRSTFNRTALKLEYAGGTGPLGIRNEGFKGLAVRAGAAYALTLDAKAATAGGQVTVSLERPDGSPLATASIGEFTREWGSFKVVLAPTATEANARVIVSIASPGTVWLDSISMFPQDTWKNRPGGFRADLMEMINELRPGFMRFPGGCWVEGTTMADAYRWKQTLGPVADRRTQANLWRYKSTHGLGYQEYLQLCEDLNTEPLFVINCGMSHRENVPLEKMPEFVQDALDALEYANGPADSEWGRRRAAAGHPAPFNLKYLEIGNENGGRAYDERYALIYDAVKAKYPDVRIIANEWQGRPRLRPIEILDEHYYNTPGWFLANADKYDGYDRKGPKIYVGEYAVTRGGVGQGNLRAAVAEAAFMTGLERNSDIVVMTSYAPLLSHVGYKVWNPDAIMFDGSRAYGTPSYWVQQMFAVSRPDVTLPVSVSAAAEMPVARAGTVGVGTWRTQAEFKELRVMDAGGKELLSGDLTADPGKLTTLAGQWTATEGAARQTSNADGAFLIAPALPASDYVLTVRACKLSGAEGFLIRFHSLDKDNYTMWNVGGWNNSRSAIEVCDAGAKSELGTSADFKVEPNRWYDLRVEVAGHTIKCFADGKLIQEGRYAQPKALFAAAGRTQDEIILKLVNASGEPQETTLRLDGLTGTPVAKALTLTSLSPDDENTLDNPRKVAPKESEIPLTSNTLRHTFPARSVTLLRIPQK